MKSERRAAADLQPSSAELIAQLASVANRAIMRLPDGELCERLQRAIDDIDRPLDDA